MHCSTSSNLHSLPWSNSQQTKSKWIRVCNVTALIVLTTTCVAVGLCKLRALSNDTVSCDSLNREWRDSAAHSCAGANWQFTVVWFHWNEHRRIDWRSGHHSSQFLLCRSEGMNGYYVLLMLLLQLLTPPESLRIVFIGVCHCRFPATGVRCLRILPLCSCFLLYSWIGGHRYVQRWESTSLNVTRENDSSRYQYVLWGFHVSLYRGSSRTHCALRGWWRATDDRKREAQWHPYTATSNGEAESRGAWSQMIHPSNSNVYT